MAFPFEYRGAQQVISGRYPEAFAESLAHAMPSYGAKKVVRHGRQIVAEGTLGFGGKSKRRAFHLVSSVEFRVNEGTQGIAVEYTVRYIRLAWSLLGMMVFMPAYWLLTSDEPEGPYVSIVVFWGLCLGVYAVNVWQSLYRLKQMMMEGNTAVEEVKWTEHVG